MRAIRELPLAAPLLLAAAALFFGGGPGNGSLPWLGGAAASAIVVLLATRGFPGGAAMLLPLAALTLWVALSIAWSDLPDRSWDYANRTFVYLLFALLGLWLAGRTRPFALGLAVVLGAVVVWSLAGKVLPFLYGDYGRIARLRAPVGLWNQLALVGDFALPLVLWLRGRGGTLLAYGWLVALVLTYSRGGLITAVLVLTAWFVLDDERYESARTLVAAAIPAGVVVAVALALPGVTGDDQPTHVRWHDGLIFGALLVAGAAGALLLRGLRLPRVSPRVPAALVVVALVLVGIVFVVKGGGSNLVGNGGGHITSTSSNFRFTWWKQAVHGWQHAKLAGTGAGTFHVTNLRYRSTYLDETTEPHDLPLQFLSETGVVGLVLVSAAMIALVRAAGRPRGHDLALALMLPAYLVHSLVDIDWDFVAVSAPAFLAAGAVAGRPLERRASAFAVLAAAGAALFAFVVLLLPWLGERWAGEAEVASPARAVTLANRARAVDPLLVDPLWALAFAAEIRGELPRALAYYDEATRKQPANPQTWLAAGQFALRNGCARKAYAYLLQYVERDNKARATEGADDYRRALRLVDSGKPTC
jgi:energy-converting hydrogenase Eha subunit A